MLFAPGHDCFTGKTAIAAHDDANLAAKALANRGHDLLERFNGALAGIALAIAQLGKERNVTAKAVQRQVAVGPIKAVKISPFLFAMERIIGGIKIQHDLAAFTCNGFDSTLEEQLFDLIGLGLDFVVSLVDGLSTQLQTIKHRMSGQRFAFIALQKPIASQRIAFAADQCLQRIASQVVMIIEIFVAQYQSVNPLSDQLDHAVLDIALVPVVDKTAGKIL